MKVEKVIFRVTLKMTTHHKKCPKLFSQLKCSSKFKIQNRQKFSFGKLAKGGSYMVQKDFEKNYKTIVNIGFLTQKI